MFSAFSFSAIIVVLLFRLLPNEMLYYLILILKFQLLLLYKEGDGDLRRRELINLILEHDPILKQILESDDYITKLKTYLDSKYY